MAGVRETDEQAMIRWDKLAMVQEHYKDFDILLGEVIEGLLGFTCTDLQYDIGDWVAKGPKYRMVQAQRGQAKTTITAAYAVYRIIHNPGTRVLIVSSGEDMATEIANWIIQIINGLDELECLRPDRSNGDRASVTAYDIHYTLKGPEKSPSIACIGITSNMQGKRADLLIADDVESQKNSATQVQRARITLLTKDFISINSTGDIVWLGTPQSIDSLYNGLPGRGVAIRIWPGRYPTEVEEAAYGAFLAPLIASRMHDTPSLRYGGGPTGERGQVTDPVLLSEEALTEKEIDQGPAYFQLQHMLNTELSDQDRYPLKMKDLRFGHFDAAERMGPMTVQFIRSAENLITLPAGFPVQDKAWRVEKAKDYAPISPWHMYVDPSGGGKNGDELAVGITGMIAGRVILAEASGMKGGLGEEQLKWLTDITLKWKPGTISIEKNYGNGALASVWLPQLRKAQVAANVQPSGIEEVWESGQKELRIIDILEPVIGAGKLIVDEGLLERDWQECQKYPTDVRETYSLFWQLARLTRDRGSLIHDDRLDAVAGSVRFWIESLSIDDEKAVSAAKLEAYQKMMKDPLGDGRTPISLGPKIPVMNALAKFGLGGVSQHLRRN